MDGKRRQLNLQPLQKHASLTWALAKRPKNILLVHEQKLEILKPTELGRYLILRQIKTIALDTVVGST